MSDEVFGGATTSQHVDAEDDDHFENTTFKLKRTRSLGLLDEFIPEKLKDQSLEAGKRREIQIMASKQPHPQVIIWMSIINKIAINLHRYHLRLHQLLLPQQVRL